MSSLEAKLGRGLLIGFGRMGQRHFKHLLESPLAKQFAIVDQMPPDRAFTEKHPDIRFYSDASIAVAEENPKWAIIAVSTTAHHSVALPLIQAGIHVLIEKPIAPTESEGRELIEEARKTGAKVFVGHSERFNPVVVALRTFLQAHDVRNIHSISLTRWGAAPAQVDPGNNVVLDLTVHDIDILHSLGFCLGNIQSSLLSRGSGNESYVAQCEVIANLSKQKNSQAKESIATLSTSWNSPERLRLIRLLSDKGILEADLLNQQLTWAGDKNFKAPEISKQFPIELQLSAFIESLNGKTSDICTAEQGLEAILVAQKILRA